MVQIQMHYFSQFLSVAFPPVVI